MEPGRAINGVIQKKFKVCGLLGESPAEIHSQPWPVQWHLEGGLSGRAKPEGRQSHGSTIS